MGFCTPSGVRTNGRFWSVARSVRGHAPCTVTVNITYVLLPPFLPPSSSAFSAAFYTSLTCFIDVARRQAALCSAVEKPRYDDQGLTNHW